MQQPWNAARRHAEQAAAGRELGSAASAALCGLAANPARTQFSALL